MFILYEILFICKIGYFKKLIKLFLQKAEAEEIRIGYCKQGLLER